MEAAAAAAKAASERERLLLGAASMGLLADVEDLVAQGASVAAVDDDRCGALHLAAARDHGAVITFLLSRGADADAEDKDGRTALHVASLSGQVGAAEALVTAGAWVDATDGGDATPLLLASRSGSGALVRLLLAAGAKHGVRDGGGLSPLAHAVANDSAEAVQALLSAGADASYDKPRGASLLHLAAALGAVRCARLLLGRAGGAALRDDANALRWMPLHAAAAAARPELLQLLLGWREGGCADADARCADGKTALDCCGCAPPAAADDAAECERLLIAHGARRGAEFAPPTSAPQSQSQSVAPNAAAVAFAALPLDAQTARLERWADASAMPGATAAPPADFPGADASYDHVVAAGALRLDAALDDVIARMLDDDDWQALMASPAVRGAVEEVQRDARAVDKWGGNAACMAALGELRRLQAFCKPRGLRTSLPALLRRADNTAERARDAVRRKSEAARNATEAARLAILAHARGDAQQPSPDPSVPSSAPKARRAEAVSEIQPHPSSPPPLVSQSALNAMHGRGEAGATGATETAGPTYSAWQMALAAWPGWRAFWSEMRWVLLRQLGALAASLVVMYALGMVGFGGADSDSAKADAAAGGFEDL